MTRPLLGLIGAIGAGKSTAARLLADLGGAIVDCDALGHRALTEVPVIRQLTDHWGSAILNNARGVDRRSVGRIVFADPGERRFLESVVFPVIRQLANAQLQSAEENLATRFHVLDAAVLLEAGWHDACDKILYIDAAYDLRLGRLESRSGWGSEELSAREVAQWPAARKRELADAVVVNDGSVEELSAGLAFIVTGWGWLAELPQDA